MDYTTDFSEIKEILKELARSQQELQTAQKETDLKFKETDSKFKETDKQIKRAFDLFEGQWGKLMESLVEGDLINLLQQRGMDVHETSQRRKGNHNGQNFEFDIIAHNGNEIVVVEVKTTLRVKHVQEFVQKLRHVREWLKEYKNFKVYGAIAFLRAEESSDAYAENEQLFVIKATGKSASIMNSEDFVPRIF